MVRVAIAVDGNNGGAIVKVGHLLALIAVVLGGFGPQAVRATFHEIDVNEVYSNADGSIQYVELIARASHPPPDRSLRRLRGVLIRSHISRPAMGSATPAVL